VNRIDLIFYVSGFLTFRFPSRVMEVCDVAGYRQILESLEAPGRWKEKTLQAG